VTENNSLMDRFSKFQKWNFRGMREEVSAVLKKAIFEGLYEPGQQIYEAELAKTLGLSRGPIREALLQLEKESLVEHIFNRGWFVIELQPQKLKEIIGIRAVLELIALKLARQKITERDLKRLRKIQANMAKAHEQQKLDDAIQADFQFHQELWKISGHRVLEDTLKAVTTPYFAFFRVIRLREPVDVESYGQTVKNHLDILDFLAGQADISAETCLARHFRMPDLGDWRSLLSLLCDQE